VYIHPCFFRYCGPSVTNFHGINRIRRLKPENYPLLSCKINLQTTSNHLPNGMFQIHTNLLRVPLPVYNCLITHHFLSISICFISQNKHYSFNTDASKYPMPIHGSSKWYMHLPENQKSEEFKCYLYLYTTRSQYLIRGQNYQYNIFGLPYQMERVRIYD